MTLSLNTLKHSITVICTLCEKLIFDKILFRTLGKSYSKRRNNQTLYNNAA